MGTNVDLCKEWDLPKVVTCPSCDKETETPFEEYDVEVARAIGLTMACEHCEYEWIYVPPKTTTDGGKLNRIRDRLDAWTRRIDGFLGKSPHEYQLLLNDLFHQMQALREELH